MRLIRAILAAACLLPNALHGGAHAASATVRGVDVKEEDVKEEVEPAAPVRALEEGATPPGPEEATVKVKEEGEPAAPIRALQEEEGGEETTAKATANKGDLRLIGDDEDIGADHYFKKYETGSCTCAHEANMAIRRAVADEFKTLPLVQGIYETLQIYLDRFLDYAVCAFYAIDCGCDGKYPRIINYYKVSTFQCCCDVHAMKDIIIKAVKKIATSWKMKMVGDGVDMMLVVDPQSVRKPYEFDVFERDFQVAVASVEKIGEIYGIPDECDEFDATGDDITCPQDGPMTTVQAVDFSGQGGPPPRTDTISGVQVLVDWFQDSSSWVEYSGNGRGGTFGPFPSGCKVSILFEYMQPFETEFPNETVEIRVDESDGDIVGVFDPTTTGTRFGTKEVELYGILPGARHKIYLVANPDSSNPTNGNFLLRSFTLTLS